jgi:hypothetical protein
MPFALLFIGILLLVVSIRNQQTPFVHLVAGDFTGPGNFIYWVVALVLLGAIGYIPKAKPVSNLLIVLILVVLVLKRGNPQTGVTGGIFQQLTDALGTTTKTSVGTTTSNLLGTASNLTGTLTGGG